MPARFAARLLAVRFAHNAQWQSGMGSSIAAGVSALNPNTAGAFVVPGDMPLVTVSLLRGLTAEFERNGGTKIIYPATPQGEQRNPVLWPRQYFPSLAALSGRGRGKDLLGKVSNWCIAVETGDVAGLKDIDTADDLAAARAVAEHR
jgi:molybdenum cofactor cytidylyltransferase